MSSSSQSISHKVGATFAYTGAIELPAGDWSAACQARLSDDDSLVQEFDVDLTPPVDPDTETTVTVRAEASDVATWPADKLLKCDILFYDNGSPQVKVPTQTFVIKTIKGQTSV